MSLRKVVRSALKSIDEISTREFRVTVVVCITIAALNALVVSCRIGYGDGHLAGLHQCYGPQQRDNFYDLMRLKIELALLVIAFALRFRRVAGFCISVVGTVLIEIQYAIWYLDTQRWLREMNVSDFSQMPIPSEWPHYAGLYLATPWDFVLFVFATAVLVWQIRVLIALITRARRRKKSA